MAADVPLSPRERDIALLIVTGAGNKEIARQLGISPKTVKNILTNVFLKTHTRSRTELAVRLIRSENRRAGATQPRQLARAFRCTPSSCPFVVGKLIA